MSTDPTSVAGEQPQHTAAPGEPTEDELRAAYEAELSRITTTDMIAQATVSLLNLGARRLGAPPAPAAAEGVGSGPQAPADGRDLEQVRDAIDAARALLDVLDRTIPQEIKPLRDALSQLQMAYARDVQNSAPDSADTVAGGERPPQPATAAGNEQASSGGGETPTATQASDGPGPAEASGRLWVPGR